MTKKYKINAITHTSNIIGNILTNPITHTSNIVGNILTSKTTHKFGKKFRRVNNFVFPKKRKG